MRAPDVSVLLHSGVEVPLASLYREPLALVFLRHFG